MARILQVQPDEINVDHIDTSLVLTIHNKLGLSNPDYSRLLTLYLRYCQRVGTWITIEPEKLYFRDPDTKEKDEAKTAACFEDLVSQGFMESRDEGFAMTTTGAERLQEMFPKGTPFIDLS